MSQAIPVQAYLGPEGSRRLRLEGFSEIQHIKVVVLLALSTDRIYPLRKTPFTHFR
jgi:hypothetical protein